MISLVAGGACRTRHEEFGLPRRVGLSLAIGVDEGSIVAGVEAICPRRVGVLLLPRDWVLYRRQMAIPAAAVSSERHAGVRCRRRSRGLSYCRSRSQGPVHVQAESDCCGRVRVTSTGSQRREWFRDVQAVTLAETRPGQSVRSPGGDGGRSVNRWVSVRRSRPS